MKQETNLPANEPTIEQAIAEYVSLEPDFQTAKSLRDRLRTRIIDHAKAQPAAFAGNEKSFHMGNGVVVRRATKTVNRFDAENGISETEVSPDGIIDRTRVRLLGIVCESESLECRASEGKLALYDGCDRCFDNIAARLQKEDIPLFDGMKDEKRKRRLLRRS